MKISCKQSCKKTSQLKSSEHCSGLCDVDGSSIKFDCDTSLSSLSQADRNFATCSFWDMGLKDTCLVCPLDCKENKNTAVTNVKTVIKSISTILESLGPLMQMSGVDPAQIKKAYEVMGSPNISANMSKDIDSTLKITNYARDILNLAMSGKNIDIVEFRKVKELLDKKYRT